MDPFKRLTLMDGQLGRLMRNLSLQRLHPLQNNNWPAAADVYESDEAIIVVMDVSGVDPDNISVVAEGSSVTVSGERRLPVTDKINRIHQLEIERGFFERTLSLPRLIDTSATTSTYKNGFLVIKMPKLTKKGKVRIEIS